MDDFRLFVQEVGPILAVFVMIAVGFVQNNRSMSHVQKITATSSAGMQEATAGSITVLNRIAEEQVRTVSDLREKLTQERETNYKKMLEIVELQGTLTDTVLTLGHRERELEDTREALEAIKRAKDALGEQLTTLSTNVGQMATRLEEVEAKLSEAEGHISDLEGQQKSMKAELEEAKRLREEAEQLNNALTEERDRLVADNQAQAELIEQYTMRLAGFEEENRQLKERLTELELKIERMNHVDESSKLVSDVGGAGDAAGADGGGGAGS